MTYKNTKTILFASLIVAMVLPFSGMQSANATHGGWGVDHDNPTEFNYEERQQNLVDMLADIELRIASGPNDLVIEQMELIKQQILGKLLESSLSENSVLEPMDPYPFDFELSNINFSIEGDHLGCDGQIESWSYEGVLRNGRNLILISQDFPDELTDGVPTECSIIGWTNNIHLAMQPAFFGEGCQGNLVTNSTANYALNCQTNISGLWIVGITFHYDTYTETKYTYVDV